MKQILEDLTKLNLSIVILALCSLIFFNSISQELEPRAINNLPVGTNFVIGGYGYAKGNTLLDPALPIEDLNSNIHSGFAAYLKSISFFGLSAKVDAIVPYVMGDWEGSVDNEDGERLQNGFGDLRLRFSFNFLGSKAMNDNEFKDYVPDKVSGFSLQIIAPTGSYNPDELINIGSNRWVFKPQLGFAKNYNKWVIESYVAMWVFTNNTNFLDGNNLSQAPLYTAKLHVIRTLPKNMWLSIGAGYGLGGKTKLNDIPRDTEISTARFGLTYAIPIAQKHTFRFSYISGVRFKKGSDFNALALTYQYRWNNSINNK